MPERQHIESDADSVKNAEQSLVPQASGSGWMILGIGSPVLNSFPLKNIKINPDPPDLYPKFCAWLVQILGFVQPIIESGQQYDDDGEFEFLAEVRPVVEQLKRALTNAAHRVKRLPALLAKCDTYCRPDGLSAFLRKLRRDIERGTLDRLLLGRISDAIEDEADDSALAGECASVAESPDARRDALTADLASSAVRSTQPSSSIDTIPPLDKTNGEWVKQEEAATIVQLDAQTLANDRLKSNGGRKSGDELSGIDRRGRSWRKDRPNDQIIWYHKSSLSNKPT